MKKISILGSSVIAAASALWIVMLVFGDKTTTGWVIMLVVPVISLFSLLIWLGRK